MLVERSVGGGVRASGVLKELVATGAVKMTRYGAVRAMRRSAAAGGADPETVKQLGEYTNALLVAFEHNLSSRVPRPAGPEEGAQSEVVIGSFAFTSVQPLHAPEPRWQRGLAERLRRPGTARSAGD